MLSGSFLYRLVPCGPFANGLQKYKRGRRRAFATITNEKRPSVRVGHIRDQGIADVDYVVVEGIYGLAREGDPVFVHPVVSDA